MNKIESERIDEVGPNYSPSETISKINKGLFWLNAVFALMLLFYPNDWWNPYSLLQAIGITIASIYFFLSLTDAFYFLPRAEAIRKRQLLSRAFNTKLTKEITNRYYNNGYPAGLDHLAAIVFENSFFGMEITKRMLDKARKENAAYVFFWIFLFALRIENTDVLKWGTQVILSSAILTKHIGLELLHHRLEQIYRRMWEHFHHNVGSQTDSGKAKILDVFVDYETAKATTRVLQDSKIFDEINSHCSVKWERIKADLGIPA